jgi:hypothetical protein
MLGRPEVLGAYSYLRALLQREGKRCDWLLISDAKGGGWKFEVNVTLHVLDPASRERRTYLVHRVSGTYAAELQSE